MSDLRLNLDTIAFKELVELGRSMIPTVAPGWTDHNVHDPGIMLMELAAWVADAQVYALSRTSRGEREAFAHLLGLELAGPRPARGLIWPLSANVPAAAPSPYAPGTIVGVGAKVTGDRPQAPAFYTTRRIELTTAALSSVATRFADGSIRDWTRANSQQGATFVPFGDVPRPGDTLQLTLTGTLIAKPAKPSRPSQAEAGDGLLSIGFEILGTPGERDQPGGCGRVRLRVSLADAQAPWPISVVDDSTAGLSHSGVLLLKVDPALAGQAGVFTLSIQSDSGGFLLTPRVQRIALNVLPVEQVEQVADERPFGTGTPDQRFVLEHAGLMYPVDEESFTVLLSNGSAELQPWKRTKDLEGADPDAAVYELDEVRGEVQFGNGLNGRMPAAGATLRIDYRVTAGAPGNLPRGVQWTVLGVPGPFGVNSEVTSGGLDTRDLGVLRAEARQKVRHARPIVTTRDLEDAARSFADLGVRRAHELPPVTSPRRLAGARVLLAVGPHDGGSEPDRFEESALWLSEIRRRLVPRLPLGQTLDVIGPKLIDVRVIAHLVAAPQIDPDALGEAVASTLRGSLATTTAADGAVWPFGRDLTALTVKGWLRNVPGVSQVVSVAFLSPPAADPLDRIVVGPIALPRLRIEPGDITIDRPPIGARP